MSFADSADKPRRGRGRPPEDRPARQREIFAAVAPGLERSGARGLSMQAAARSAHMSVGGLYHYFPTKRDLVLHPLTPEYLARRASDFRAAHGGTRHDPEKYGRLRARDLAETLPLVRPAARAAAELGVDTAPSALDRWTREAFADVEIAFAERLSVEDAGALADALREAYLTAALDPSAVVPALAAQLDRLITSQLERASDHLGVGWAVPIR